MTVLLRQILVTAMAAVLSWWLLLRAPAADGAPTEVDATLPIAVTPHVQAPPPEPEHTEPTEEPASEPESPPPPPERGAPEGEADPETPDELNEEETEPDPTPRLEPLMTDGELLAAARRELSGEVRKGFTTVFVTAPEDQVAIARFFGEELVLVPHRAVTADTETQGWFRLTHGDAPQIEHVAGRPPLQRYRQYRDLFDYEYARLPEPLRALRRSVLLRSEVYLFAALIPASEWAAVIGRRRQALALAGRHEADVRRFVIRYDRRADATYDLVVQEIVFADGTRYRPE